MNLITNCVKYIYAALGVSPEIQQLPEVQKKKLPYFINDSYQLHKCSLLIRDFVLMVLKDNLEYTPAELAKHADLVRNQLSTDVVLLLSELTSYNRKRLIGHKVPFIVPKKQMYLPDLLIDLREHCKIPRENKREFLSPSAQIVLLYCILNKKYSLLPNDLIDLFPYTRMTLNRAFDELVSFDFAEKEFQGRDKLLHFTLKGKELWQRALPLLKSPVKKRIFISGIDSVPKGGKLAGISALAEYSMIADNEIPVYAMEKNSLENLLRGKQIYEIPSIDGADAIVEIWNFPPGVLSNKNIVDPLSLYLTLKDNYDERIQGELNSMMEAKIW